MPNPLAEALAQFDLIVELPERERAAAIAALDPSVAVALRALLRADAASSGVLDRGVQAIATDLVNAATRPEVDAAALKAGDLVGGFVLQRLLGRGGMGEVWLAERRESDAAGAFVQQVALKVLKRGMDSESISARFMQERKILAGLNHPHFARFIDGGISREGRLYFAMEYVDGTNLLEHAAANNLTVRERVRLLAEVSEAVAYAQNHLVVHRDLKPSNILVDVSGAVRVLDFGIAKLLGERAPNDTLTHTGVHALSPAYAAPEQVLGQPISTATDVYALGAILFELVTGIQAHTRRPVSFEALVAQINTEETPVPSKALRRSSGVNSAPTITRALREVEGDLDTIILTAMQREPARRYASAAALADDLRRWLDARPIAARADTRSYRMKKFIARNRVMVGGASAVMLALIAGLAVAIWQAGIAREQARIAQTQTQLAELAAKVSAESADRTRRVKEFMMRTFVAADPMRRSEVAPVTVAAAFEDALKRIDSEVADDPKLQVDLLDDFGEVLSSQGRFDEAKARFDRGLALAEKHYPANDPVIAETLLNLTQVNFSQGDVGAAALTGERALAILQAHEADMPQQFAAALSAMTVVRHAQGRQADALKLAKRVLDLNRTIAKSGSEALVSALHNYATTLLAFGRHNEAEPFAREALLEAEKLGGAHSATVEKTLVILSAILDRQGKSSESIAIDERRLAILKSVYPNGHPSIGDVLADMGWSAMSLGQNAKARSYLDAAIESLKGNSARIVYPLRFRALLEVSQNNFKAALADFDRSLSHCTSAEVSEITCIVLRINRANLLARMGRGSEAMTQVELAIADLTARELTGDNEYAQALEAKASAFHALGQFEQAITTQNAAIAAYTKVFGATHAEVLRAQSNLERLKR